jgi:adenylate kinase family enzyme
MTDILGTQESVLERLRVYRIHTQPLLDYYASKGLLEVIDSPTSDIGYIQIKKILTEKQCNSC